MCVRKLTLRDLHRPSERCDEAEEKGRNLCRRKILVVTCVTRREIFLRPRGAAWLIQ